MDTLPPNSGTVNLDTRYYTETESDTLFTKKSGQGIISGSTFSSPSQGTVRTINGSNTDVDTGLQTGDSPQFTNLTLTGDLNVSGTTTFTSTNNVNIGDNILELNYGGSNTTSGIYVKDGLVVQQQVVLFYGMKQMIIGKAGKRVLKYKLRLVNGTYSGLRAQSTTKSDVGLGNVENTGISTFDWFI